MIILSKEALKHETRRELFIDLVLVDWHCNCRDTQTVGQSSEVVHLVFVDWILNCTLFVIKHLLYQRRSISSFCIYRNWRYGEVKVVRDKGLAVLINEESTQLLSFNYFLVEVLESGGEQEVSQENSTLYIQSKGGTSYSLDVVKQILFFGFI